MLEIMSSEFQRGVTGTPWLRKVIEEGEGEIQVLNGRGSDRVLRSVRLSYVKGQKEDAISMRDFKRRGSIKEAIKLIHSGVDHVYARIDGSIQTFRLTVVVDND